MRTLLIFLALLIPFLSHAQTSEDYTFEENRQIDVVLRANGSFLYIRNKADMVHIGKPIPLSYWFSGILGDLQSDDLEYTEEKARFNEYISTYRMYLQIWKGIPHQSPTLLSQEDISGNIAGIRLITLPSIGDYFVVTVMTDERIVDTCPADMSSPCVTEQPISTDSYFINPVEENPHLVAYGGMRFRVDPDTPILSNVLFVPGIKGSRLYVNESACERVPCEEKVWEPSSDADIEKLFLAADGSSVRDDVYTYRNDIVDSVLGTDIYGSFATMMDELESASTIRDWETFAYDWRLSIPDLLTQGAEYADQTYFSHDAPVSSLLQTIDRLVQTSPTGKITIVAHSNGGLLIKGLLAHLGDVEAARIIEKIILVGTPQAGAPQALASLLHGYKEGIPADFPFLVSQHTARLFAENSPMGYHLLPSQVYIQNSVKPVLSFASQNSYALEMQEYGTTIDSDIELERYLTGKDGGRTKPKASEVWRPNLLNESLLAYARDLHRNLDVLTSPIGMDIYQIAGAGLPTVSGLEYKDYCSLGMLCIPTYRALFERFGDGVVPAQSAHVMAGASNFWIDLSDSDFDHGTLLAMPEVQDAVSSIITGQPVQTGGRVSTEEIIPVPERQFILYLHSPLTLGARDDENRYTGITVDGKAYEDIPNSQYGIVGEVQFLILPGDREYEVVLDGLDEGKFTLEIQEFFGNELLHEAVFLDIPTTEDTVVKTVLGSTSIQSMQLEIHDESSAEATVGKERNRERERSHKQKEMDVEDMEPQPVEEAGIPVYQVASKKDAEISDVSTSSESNSAPSGSELARLNPIANLIQWITSILVKILTFLRLL